MEKPYTQQQNQIESQTLPVLQPGDQRWIDMIDSTGRGIALTDPLGNIVIWSAGMVRITGIPAQQVIGMPIWEVHLLVWAPELRTPENLAMLPVFYQNMLHTGQTQMEHPDSIVGKLIRPNGESFFIEGDLIALPEKDGFILGYMIRDITARIVEQNLNLVQGYALEAAANAVVITDPQGTILWANPAFTRTTGYSLEEAIGQKPSILKSGFQDEAFYQQLWDEISAGRVWKGQLVNRRKDGSLYTEEMIITPVLSPVLNVVQQFIAVKEDITARLITQAALQENEHLLRTLFENLAEGVALVDPDENFLFVNPAAESIFGVRAGELVGRNLCNFIDDETAAEIQAQTKQRRLGKTSQYEHAITRPDGTKRALLVSATPRYDSLGQFTGTLGVFRDITETIENARALQRSEELFRGVVENSNDGIVIVDEAGRIIEWNPAMEKISAISAAQACGQFVWDMQIKMMHPRMQTTQTLETLKANFHDRFSAKITEIHGQPVEWAFYLPDGTERIAEQSTAAIRTEMGILISNTIRDITEHKLDEKTTQLRLKLIEYAKANPIDEFVRYALDEIGILTSSPITRLHIVEPQHPERSNQTWSNWRDSAHLIESGVEEEIVAVEKQAWFDCIRKKKPVILNNLTPPTPGSSIQRLLLAPILRSGKIVAILSVGNKTIQYTARDVEIITYLADVLWETTKNKKVELALQQREARYRLLAENATDVIWTTDNQLRFTYISPAIMRLRGLTPEEAMLESIQDTMPPASLAQFIEVNHRRMVKEVTGEPLKITRLEVQQFHKDGSLVWVEIIVQPLQDDKGQKIGYLGVSRDIGERKKAEEALAHSEVQLRMILEASPDSIVLTNVLDRFEYCNQSALKMFGVANYEELAGSGKTIYDFIAPEFHKIFFSIGNRLQTITQPESIEVNLQRHDGAIFPAEITWTLIRDQYGQPQNYLSIIRDATLRKQTEQALRDYADEQEMLFAISSAAVEHMEQQKLLPRVLDALTKRFNPDIAWIYVNRPEPFLVVNCPIDQEAELRIKQVLSTCQSDLTGLIIEYNHPNLLKLLQEPALLKIIAMPDAAQPTTVCIALAFGEYSLGRLTMIWKNASIQTRQSEPLFGVLGQQLTIALRNIELYQAARQVNRLQMLHQISAKITATLEPKVILQQIMETLSQATSASGASFMRLVPETGELVFEAALPGESAILLGQTLAPATGIAGWVVQNKQSVNIQNVQNDDRYYKDIEVLTQLKVQSLICAPVLISGQVKGVIQLINKQYSKFSYNEFSQDDLALLEAVASIAAVALENARLLEEAQARADETAKLYENLKKVMVERERVQSQLIQSEKISALGRLAASFAHEINNPLQAVKGCLSLFDEEMEGDRNQQKLDQYMGIVRSEIDRVVTLVRNMREFYRPARQSVETTDVHNILENVLALTAKELSNLSIQIHTEFYPQPLIIQTNPDYIKQVFMNMIINASEAMPDGGLLKISTSLAPLSHYPDSPHIVIQFSDTGCGITPEVQNRLFEPFFTTKEGGSGLGLYISRSIIESYGGQLKVASQVNEGATFTIFLPLFQEALA